MEARQGKCALKDARFVVAVVHALWRLKRRFTSNLRRISVASF
jgi:ribosomal protein L28